MAKAERRIGWRQRWSGKRARPSQVRQNRVVASRRRLASSRSDGTARPSAHDSAHHSCSPWRRMCRDLTRLPRSPGPCRSPAARSGRRRSPRPPAGPRPPASSRPRCGRSRRWARRSAPSRRARPGSGAVRTSRWSASSSAGGRVWGVTSSSPCRGPMVSESRTSTQPVGVFQVVISVLVPGSYARCDGTLMLNGPSRKAPACRSSSAPNRLGESNRGTHSQSTVPSGATSAPVWQLERKA